MPIPARLKHPLSRPSPSQLQLRAQKRDASRRRKWAKMLGLDPRQAQGLSALDCDDLLPLRAAPSGQRFLHRKMRARIRKGVPPELRRVVWLQLSGACELMAERPALFAQLAASPRECSDEAQIAKDVHRTYCSRTLGADYHASLQKALHRILKAYALHDREIGYCQGMNNVAALMLRFMGEEETFWVLVAMANGPLYEMREYWGRGLPKLKLRFYQLMRVLANTNTKTYEHLKLQDFTDPSMYGATSFFIDPFLSLGMKHNTIVRLWDVYLSEGVKWTLKVFLAILRHCKRRLKKMQVEEMRDLIHKAYAELEPDQIVAMAAKVRLSTQDLAKLERDFAGKTPNAGL